MLAVCANAVTAQPDLSQPEIEQASQAGSASQDGVVGDGRANQLGPAAIQPRLAPDTLRLNPKPSIWDDLFAGSVSDIKRLPSKQTLGWLAIGAVAAAGTHSVDRRVSQSLGAAKTLHEPLEPGAVLGSTPFQLGASITTYAIARWTDRPRLTQVSADLIRAQLLAEGLTIGLKRSIRRDRPDGSGFAFPSGHTTVSFASATVLQRHYGWKLGLPAYGVASYVALSRVQMRRHYLSDVAFGAALGIVTGRTVTLGRGPTFALSPSVSQEGAGLQFTLVGK